jgi:hypothetical protein
MPETGDAAQWDWDLITLVGWWNLYLLPASLVTVVIGLVIHRRLRPESKAGLGAALTIQRIGLIHLVLGLRALLHLAQEAQTFRAMGIFQSNPVSNVITTLSVLINPLLGIGLWRLRPGARRGAIVWDLLWSLIAAWVTYWIWRYHAHVDPADWPDHVVGKALPWFLLFVMLRPQTRHLFASRSKSSSDAKPSEDEGPAAEKVRPSQRDWPIVARVVIGLLIVACSTLVVDAADWVYRAINEAELG